MSDELLKCKADPIYFIEKYMTLQGKPIKLWNSQKRFIVAHNKHRRNLNMEVRDTGTTTVLSLMITHQLIFNDNKIIGYIGFNMGECKYMIDMVHDHICNVQLNLPQTTVEVRTIKQIKLNNNSRLYCIPGSADATRAIDFDWLIISSCTLQKYGEQLYQMALPSTPKITLTSFADKKDNWFYVTSIIHRYSFNIIKESWRDNPNHLKLGYVGEFGTLIPKYEYKSINKVLEDNGFKEVYIWLEETRRRMPLCTYLSEVENIYL